MTSLIFSFFLTLFLFEKKCLQVPSDLVTSSRNITGEPSPPEQALKEGGTESSQLDTDIDSLNKAGQMLSADPVSLKEETSAHVSNEDETEQHDEEKLEQFVTAVVLDKVEITTEQVSDQVVVEENRIGDKMVSVEVLPSAPVLDKVEITTEQVSDQVVVEENRIGDKMVSVEVLPSAPVLDKVEITTEQVSDQVVVEENRIGDKMVSVEVQPSAPVLDKVEIITEQVSDQVVVEDNRIGDNMVSVEVQPSAPVLEKVEITTDQVSDQVVVEENRVANKIISVEVPPSAPMLDNLEIATDQVSDQLEVDEDNEADVMVSVLEGIPSVAVLDNVEIATDQVSDQLEVDEDNTADIMVLEEVEISTDQVSDVLEDCLDEIVTVEVLPSVALLDKVESTTDQASDEVVVAEARLADEILSLEVSPSVSVLDEVSDHVEVDEESLLGTGSVESLTRALDKLEMENATEPMFSPLEHDQGFECESITVECFTPSVSKTIGNTTDHVPCQLKADGESLVKTESVKSLTAGYDEIAEAGTSYVFETKTVEPTTPSLFSKAMQSTTDRESCQLEVGGESLVETGSIKSLTARFDEIEDTLKSGSSYVFETKSLEPNTTCLFSKEIVNTTKPGPSLADVDEESLTKIVSVDSYTCDAVVDETENETEDDMVKSSDSKKDIAQLKEQIKVLQQQLYEVNIFLLSFCLI